MDELYVLARTVLLDALEALGDHRDAVILVGSQAIYLHVGDADLNVLPYTTDGDLVLDPARLGKIPPLERALAERGFSPKKSDSVGVWTTSRPTSTSPHTEVCVDLLVPAGVSPGKGRRAARLPGHDARAARKVMGLEGALIDFEHKRLGSLAEGDSRAVDVQVAGPAALLVAKLIKLDERTGMDRQADKDALDIVRLFRGVETEELAARMERVLADVRSAAVATRAVDVLRRTFGRRVDVGIQMAIRASLGRINPDELSASSQLLSSNLLDALS